MGQAIELCRRCGFDIPGGAECCPGCGRHDEAPSLAARQVAGLALPTRSVHRLPTTRPRREPRPRSIGPARGARSAFAYTSLFVLVALLGAGLGWVARLERVALTLPHGTAERIDHLTVAVTWASLIAMTVGLLALAAWSVRRISVALARRHRRGDALA